MHSAWAYLLAKQALYQLSYGPMRKYWYISFEALAKTRLGTIPLT
jgi:hypothetical protein